MSRQACLYSGMVLLFFVVALNLLFSEVNKVGFMLHTGSSLFLLGLTLRQQIPFLPIHRSQQAKRGPRVFVFAH